EPEIIQCILDRLLTAIGRPREVDMRVDSQRCEESRGADAGRCREGRRGHWLTDFIAADDWPSQPRWSRHCSGFLTNRLPLHRTASQHFFHRMLMRHNFAHLEVMPHGTAF